VNRPRKTALTFSADTWLKLKYLCHIGETEVGFFGVILDSDLLRVSELFLPKQECTAVVTTFDDDSVADYYDSMTDRGLQPYQYSRLWIHTHPSDSADPSFADEETFKRAFGSCDWSIMMILARGGQVSCRLHHKSPESDSDMDVCVGWTDCRALNPDLYDLEYHESVKTVQSPIFGLPTHYQPDYGYANRKLASNFDTADSRTAASHPNSLDSDFSGSESTFDSDNPDDELVDTDYCPVCAEETELVDTYCAQCGHDIEAMQEVADRVDREESAL